MTRKGLIVVEQMPLLLIAPTSQKLFIQSYIGVFTSSDHSHFLATVGKQRKLASVCLVAVKLKVSKLK